MSITHKDHFVNIAKRRAMEATEIAKRQMKSSESEANGFPRLNAHSSEEPHPFFTSGCKGGFFADQFENLANFRAHYEYTGPEIWEQTGGDLHAFVAAAGTGGTLAGISRFLKVPLIIFSVLCMT